MEGNADYYSGLFLLLFNLGLNVLLPEDRRNAKLADFGSAGNRKVRKNVFHEIAKRRPMQGNPRWSRILDSTLWRNSFNLRAKIHGGCRLTFEEIKRNFFQQRKPSSEENIVRSSYWSRCLFTLRWVRHVWDFISNSFWKENCVLSHFLNSCSLSLKCLLWTMLSLLNYIVFIELQK